MSAPVPAAEVLDRYRQWLRQQERRPETISGYSRVLRLWFDHLDRCKPPVGWSEAGPEHLHAWLHASPPNRRAAARRRARKLSEGSRWSYAKIVRTFTAWATDEGLLDADPFRRAAKLRRPSPVPRALGLDQVAKLLEHAAGDRRLEVAVWLAFGQGLRCGEIAAARIEDVRLGRRPSLVVHGKGGRDRLVPLAAPVREVLGAYLAGRPRSGPLLESLRRPEGLTAHSVTQLIARAMRAAGIAETGHGLRHSFAVELLAADQGRNLRAVSRLLGHRSVVTTEAVYTAVYDADADAAITLLPVPDLSNPAHASYLPAVVTAELANGVGKLDRAAPGLADQVASCRADLERHVDAVERALSAIGPLTHAACTAFYGNHADAWSTQADDEWEQVEGALGITRLWELADRLRDAHPDG